MRRTATIHNLVAVACILAWLLVFATLAGCSADQATRAGQIDAALKQVETTRADTQKQIELARADLAAQDLDPDTRKAILNKLDKFNAGLVRLEQLEKQLAADKARLASEDPGEVIAATGRAVGSAVPGYGGIITLGATIVGGLVSAAYRARAKAAEEAIGAVTLTADAGLTTIDTAALDQMQSPAAKKAVTRAQAKARARAKALAPIIRSRPTRGQSTTAQLAAPSV